MPITVRSSLKIIQSLRVVNWIIFFIESGTNSAWYYYGVECLHLVLLRDGETRNTSTASTAVTHWNWVEQTVLIYIAINWVECLYIAACWRDTQHKHCGIYCDSLKVEQTVLVITIEWSVCTYYNCCGLERHTTQALHLLPWPLKTLIILSIL